MTKKKIILFSFIFALICVLATLLVVNVKAEEDSSAISSSAIESSAIESSAVVEDNELTDFVNKVNNKIERFETTQTYAIIVSILSAVSCVLFLIAKVERFVEKAKVSNDTLNANSKTMSELEDSIEKYTEKLAILEEKFNNFEHLSDSIDAVSNKIDIICSNSPELVKKGIAEKVVNYDNKN